MSRLTEMYIVAVRIVLRWKPLLLLDEESAHVCTYQEVPGNL